MRYHHLDYKKIRLDAEEKIPTLIKLCDNICFLELEIESLEKYSTSRKHTVIREAIKNITREDAVSFAKKWKKRHSLDDVKTLQEALIRILL